MAFTSAFPSSRSFTRRLAATAAIAAFALPVLAQQPSPASATPAAATAASAPAAAEGRQAGLKQPGERRDFQERKERRQAHRAQRLAALKAELRITPAQEPAWATYTAALQPGERHARLERLDSKALAELTTPERIDRMRAVRAQRNAEADRRGEATKAFYAALTPEQQKTFDAKAHRMHHRGKKHAGGAHGGEGRHGHHHHHHHGGKHPHGHGHPHQGGGTVGEPATPSAR